MSLRAGKVAHFLHILCVCYLAFDYIGYLSELRIKVGHYSQEFLHLIKSEVRESFQTLCEGGGKYRLLNSINGIY